jgi:hypothetical protein
MTNVGNYPARKITLRGTFANFEQKKAENPQKSVLLESRTP